MSKVQNEDWVLSLTPGGIVRFDMGGIPPVGMVQMSDDNGNMLLWNGTGLALSSISKPVGKLVVCKDCGHEHHTSYDFCEQCWGDVSLKETSRDINRQFQDKAGKAGALKNYGVIIATK